MPDDNYALSPFAQAALDLLGCGLAGIPVGGVGKMPLVKWPAPKSVAYGQLRKNGATRSPTPTSAFFAVFRMPLRTISTKLSGAKRNASRT